MATLNSVLTRLREAPLRAVALASLAAVVLAGCGSSSDVLSSGSDGAGSPNVALTTPGQPPAAGVAKIQIAPVIGSPEGVGREIQNQLTTSLERNRVSVARGTNGPSEYVLRGYVVAAREKSSTKISYIWDVTDQTGKRVNRITGEEAAPGTNKDPWSTVTPQVVQRIADRTASQIATSLPNTTASIPVADTARAQPSGSPPNSSPITTAATTPVAMPTGSIQPTGPISTMVPNVTGAPGDGGNSLTGAIQRELTKSGVNLTSAPSPQAYRVEGKVAVGQAKDGKQPIQIDWNVVDPAGKKLGTVSQKNEVATGSLDGAWGKTADAAAAAAAAGIVKLLPQQKATN